MTGRDTSSTRSPVGVKAAPPSQGVLAAPVVPPILEQAWTQVVAAWSDSRLHEAVLEAARTSEALDLAAQRYRSWLDAHPGDPEAERRLKQIFFLATHVVMGSRRHREARGARAYHKVLALVLVFALLMIGSLGVFLYLGRRQRAPVARPGVLLPIVAPGRGHASRPAGPALAPAGPALAPAGSALAPAGSALPPASPASPPPSPVSGTRTTGR